MKSFAWALVVASAYGLNLAESYDNVFDETLIEDVEDIISPLEDALNGGKLIPLEDLN
jgi:hypothetical protein